MKIVEYTKEQLYKSYVCNSLQYIPQNKYLTKSYDEVMESIFKPQMQQNIDNRSGDEIAIDIIKKAGLTFKKSEE